MRDHSGIKPYVCDYPDCGYASKQKCSLNTHVIKHLEPDVKKEVLKGIKRTLPCRECGKKYLNQKSLEHHALKAHGIRD
ncbi:UNVERIFIED_CONTAM: hypothetical protein HDU68_012883, partial [Siphonaria sp. JEL0065]